MKNTKYTIPLILLFTISCGKKATEKVSSDPQQEIATEGTYWARLGPVNTSFSKDVQGEAKIQLYGDEFLAKISLKNAPAGVHKQYLHTGGICPEIDSDINHDGFIDAEEAKKTLGDVVIPFDGDLSSINLGAESFPTGNYKYEQSTSFSLMISDLDFKQGQFALERRVVSVWGVTAVGEIPIACGILTRISDSPEVSGGAANTWNTSPSGGGYSSNGGKPPRITKPPLTRPTTGNTPRNNPPIRPPVPAEPPQEEGGILDDILGSVRRFTDPVRRWIERFIPKPNNEPSSTPTKPTSGKPKPPRINSDNNSEGAPRQTINRPAPQPNSQNNNSGFRLPFKLPFKLPFGLGGGNNNSK